MPFIAMPDREADDAGLGQRGVEAAVLAELGGQPVGDPEDAAERADVLAEHQHRRVLGHRVAQRPVERLRHRQLLVRRSSSASPSRLSSSATSAACSRSCGVGSA